MAQEYIANSKQNQIQRVKLLTGLDLTKSPSVTSTVTASKSNDVAEKGDVEKVDGQDGLAGNKF